MSILDKVIAAVTPPESDETRMKARAKAREAALPGSWLALVLDHHVMIEDAFAAVEMASSASDRRAAEKHLGTLLTAHSIAEEAVIYPAMARNGETAKSELAYVEQSAAKVQMAGLGELDPMSKDYLDKLGHLKGAVQHHVYEEEGTWFPELVKKVDAAAQQRLSARYQEEYKRYAGSSVGSLAGGTAATLLAS